MALIEQYILRIRRTLVKTGTRKGITRSDDLVGYSTTAMSYRDDRKGPV